MIQQSRMSRLDALSLIFRNPKYIAVGIVGALINYVIFTYFVLYSNRGIFLVAAPLPLIYLLAVTGGIVIAIATFAITINTIMPTEKLSGEALGVIIPAIGSMLSSCACTYPVIATVLLAAGINAFAVSNFVYLVNLYQWKILAGLVVLNLLLAYHYLGVVAKGCSTRKGRRTVRQG